MNSSRHITSAFTRKIALWAVLLMLCLSVKAEIYIGGNVYGGGDKGKVSGNTTVEVKSGNIGTDNFQNPGGSVFGGARMADVGGNAYVNINGEEATDYILINRVYGGNDIAGTIEGNSNRLPSEVANNDMAVNGTWNAIIHISDGEDETVDGKKQEKYPIYIGQLFGGSNGEYDYDSQESTYYGLARPEIAKTFIDIHGGSIVYAYAGGNAVTVTEKAAIHVHNESEVVNSIKEGSTELLTENRFKAMGINTGISHPGSDEFQIGRLFGGNNKAEMAIRPTWDLEAGSVRNLYSGGNQGAMTHKEGIFLEIPTESEIIVDNVFGGCRMADVHPLLSGTLASGNYEESQKSDIQLHNDDGTQLYDFPAGFSARLLINGGHIKNVYGGNDVTGTVYGGNAVGVAASISGNVYGGGNGSYPYTDNAELLNDPDFKSVYGDMYYNPAELNKTELSFADNATDEQKAAAKSLYSAQALNLFRPNAEQISIILMGTEEKHTEIGGVFCGGNSASVKTISNWVKNQEGGPTVELKMSSYVYVDSVFLGNNGENMVTYNEEEKVGTDLKKREGTLRTMNKTYTIVEEGGNKTVKFNSMDLENAETFKEYMMGAAMDQKPTLSFFEYTDYTSYIGSLYCGGNVGSMIYSGTNNMDFDVPIVIFNKLVGGCNNANISEVTGFNAAYEGGIMGSEDELAPDGLFRENKDNDGAIQDRLVLNFEDLKIEPRRWKTDSNGDYIRDANGNRVLEWNTVIWDNDEFVSTDQGSSANTTNDSKRRLAGGNIYGGCNNRGYVNGNVVININNDLIVRNKVFADTKEGTNIDPEDGKIELLVDDTKNRNSGVILDKQSFDVDIVAMTVFGAGYGDDTEIWGSTTVNLNKGYTFQIFGGGYAGEVGKKVLVNNDYVYEFNPEFSTTVSLNGKYPATSETDYVEDLPESEYLYAGGNEGNVAGNTYMYLGNGRIYDAFGGASAADIKGHTEVYIGLQRDDDGGHTKSGFPWIRDIVYGGNDFGGTIYGNGSYDFSNRVRDYSTTKSMIHGYNEPEQNETEQVPSVLKSSAYVEYLQGRVDTIFGGSYGNYDYVNEYPTETMPYLHNTFVNIRPIAHQYSSINAIFGGSTGHPANRKGDKSQDCSYVLIDIPDNIENFKNTEVFGAGSYNGLGMGVDKDELADGTTPLDKASAIIDLLHGNISAAYGGSYNEGVTRRTVVNVPDESTINIKNIFGGAFGTQILPPCDVYETHVNYRNTSENARVTGAIYGGNNNERRSLYTQVNISSPVWSNKDRGYTATVYGAGRGIDTWSEYTEVNLENGAIVYEVYGGGEMGHVLNSESVQKYMQLYKEKPSPQISRDDPRWKDDKYWNLTDGNKVSLKDQIVDEETEETIDVKKLWAEDWADAWTLGEYYEPNNDYTNYVSNDATNLSRVPERPELKENESTKDLLPRNNEYKYNTNVIINEGATVVGYAYGGGLGESATPMTGDVYGTAYIALLGGKVQKDLYAAGTSGAVYNLFETKGAETFTATANAYVKVGSVRIVYGGGWEGNVGRHDGDLSADPTNDIPGETHVVIGNLNGNSFTDGVPTIQRNAYGGGEGGAVFGTANITINNGYIGYVHLNANEKQNEKGEIVSAQGEGLQERYEEKIIDETHKNKETNQFIPNTNLYDAGCVFGGGYVDNSSVDKTNVTIYGGHIRNSAFGGGEIAAVGRGAINETTQDDNIIRTLAGLYRPGKAHIEMYGGHVHRNVFGGGRGYDNLGRYGTLSSDGTVFGQTEVHIHGGEIGDASRLSYGDGNVFGGGDIGFVFSAYEYEEPVTVGETTYTVTKFGRGVKPTGSERYKDDYQGYYFKHQWEGDNSIGSNIDEDGFYTENVTVGETTTKERMLTEDCKVLIEPYCKALQDVTINGHAYAAGTYVTTADLNTLRNKTADEATWDKLDVTGIIINNAVFAGGNTPSGKTATNAYMASVLGNATASVNDVYHRDLITLGTGHTGGLYGDGNLTLVDGYRELNITNYGTDYYSIEKEIDINAYHALPDREAAYYELRYTCLEDCKDKDGTTYSKAKEENGVTTKASTITADDMLNLFLTEVKDDNGNIVYENDGVTPKMKSIQFNGTDVLEYDEDEHQWKPATYASGENSGQPIFWAESGVLPVYAGRLMNTIQRADFCGVWGSRMVLQGARDRVPNEADFTNYTINRVREVSLNAKKSVRIGDSYNEPDTGDKLQHGNYFGIYNIVNYLGALTSDVDFDNINSVRTTDNENHELYDPDLNPDGATITLKTGLTNEEKDKALSAAGAINGVTVSGETITAQTVEGLYKLRSVPGLVISAQKLTNQTFAQWKQVHHTERKRNNGNSHNKVALASGVYLELTTEQSIGTGLYEKDWGPITGVIELDLINVSPGIGGGFVYAKNVHGKRKATNYKNTTLTDLNEGAVTHWDYEYSTTEDSNNQMEWQTSGNFVHSTQTIIDDCYNISNKYMGNGKVPAHYWFIKGSVYVYDQYISAYTGSPNAFSEAVDIPLTITAGAHGSLKLLDIQPNLYAYYSTSGVKIESGKKIVINDKTYYLNDPISYWDWYLLTKSERALFVPMTYVNCITCNIDGKKYEAGTYVMNESEFTTYKNSAHVYTDAEGNVIQKADKTDADDDYIFRQSNNLGHDKGYILTYQVNNPDIWDTWYTEKSDYNEKFKLKAYNNLSAEDKEAYYDGPTYRLDQTKPEFESNNKIVLGQSDYQVGNIISKNVVTNYPYTDADKPAGQASFERAYLITSEVTITEGNENRHLNPGATIPASKVTEAISAKTAEAFICAKTIQLNKTDIIPLDTKMTEAQRSSYINPVHASIKAIIGNVTDDRLKEIRKIEDVTEVTLDDDDKTTLKPLLALKNDFDDYLVEAYYCTEPGKYGGQYYYTNQIYRGIDAWSSMSDNDRKYFIFNYDALDLFIDPDYGMDEGTKYQYDGNYTTAAQVEDETTGNKARYSLEQSLDYTATYNGSETGTYNGITLAKDHEYSNEQFEKLPNEQRHYVAIKVKDGKEVQTGEGESITTVYKVYVVSHASFQVGNTPYSIGSTIDYETYNGLTDHTKITELTFSASEKDNTYYYCRESYTVGENGNGVAVTNILNNEAYAVDDQVPIGVIIDDTDYGTLQANNKQKDFIFHGISPTETSTLYVSKESDIYDLSKDKIITVVYEYNYDENDDAGNVTPVSERHVLNIHLTFESGIPYVDDIDRPDIILPGDYISLKEPDVTPGAFEVTGGGWELFETARDADSHTNGIEYNPTFDPLYWYQHEWYVAYYAKTYLGRTYSKAVPVSVANYHDLANVMSDANKTHHMYIDREDVKREPKIYINDYSQSQMNGLDLLKDLFDLSILNGNSPEVTDGVVTASGTLNGHAIMNSRVQGGENLEFILRTNIDHTPVTKPNPDYDSENPGNTPATITTGLWTSIASGTDDNDPCFGGTLHGDGYTISGLSSSLFGKLCGTVYNLGVTGSFTGAGVAETGDGYIENCWINTTGTLDGTVYAVFGNPTGAGNKVQLVNSYYTEGLNYKTADNVHGLATAKPAKAFYNGEVAFDLNSFYLNKRYLTATNATGGTEHLFIDKAPDGTLQKRPSAYYNGELEEQYIYGDIGYVESRYKFEDFRYAAGTIPSSADPRYLEYKVDENDEDSETKTGYYPIWPNDYLFFGQALTYGYDADKQHQDVPSHYTGDDNRVLRAPAYFGSKTMGVVHFNADVNLAQKSADGTKDAYQGMTAIDLHGHNDANNAYTLALNDNKKFYGPLLDTIGLNSIANRDETRNLLVYAPVGKNTNGQNINDKTLSTLINYFMEPIYLSEYDNSNGYRIVDETDASTVNGHLVNSNLVSTNDHLLVDKQDFNVPIAYTFGEDNRMWYQRKPDLYMESQTGGWETVSLPFEVELVTTHQKGEITHFYDGSTIGHEYWLRELSEVTSATDQNDENKTIFTSVFKSLDKAQRGSKSVTNTFLWDYYYSKLSGTSDPQRNRAQDKNADEYQVYYNTDHTYDNYPYALAGTPYLIGWPGKRYYEFDLSGQFVAQNTADNPSKLEKQMITFASETGASIEVTDDEYENAKVQSSTNGYKYTFVPTYQTKPVTDAYLMNTDGNKFEQKAIGTTVPFRPYFTVSASSNAQKRGTRANMLYIGYQGESDQLEETVVNHGLFIYSENMNICVESTLEYPAQVTIMTVAGKVLKQFTILPATKVSVPVNSRGVYLVNHFKIAVTK